MFSKIDYYVLLAIKYIEADQYRKVFALQREIKAFLTGYTRSFYYLKVFVNYPDVCGSLPNIKDKELSDSLNRLCEHKILGKRITKKYNTLYFSYYNSFDLLMEDPLFANMNKPNFSQNKQLITSFENKKKEICVKYQVVDYFLEQIKKELNDLECFFSGQQTQNGLVLRNKENKTEAKIIIPKDGVDTETNIFFYFFENKYPFHFLANTKEELSEAFNFIVLTIKNNKMVGLSKTLLPNEMLLIAEIEKKIASLFGSDAKFQNYLSCEMIMTFEKHPSKYVFSIHWNRAHNSLELCVFRNNITLLTQCFDKTNMDNILSKIDKISRYQNFIGTTHSLFNIDELEKLYSLVDILENEQIKIAMNVSAEIVEFETYSLGIRRRVLFFAKKQSGQIFLFYKNRSWKSVLLVERVDLKYLYHIKTRLKDILLPIVFKKH